MSTLQQAPARLGNLLVERGYLTPRQLGPRAGSTTGRTAGIKLLGEILVEQGLCTEDQVVECLAEEYRRALR